MNLEEWQSAKERATRFDVGISWFYKISRRYRLTSSYKALTRPGAPRKLSDEEIAKLEQLVKENQSATLKELKQIGDFPVGITTTIHNILRQKLQLAYKKRPNKIEMKSRKLVKNGKSQPNNSAERVVCLDESTEAIVYEGGLSAKFFKTWVKECLLKTLP